jgi:MerR family mercuric resistance operon transcriptional regulator
MPPATFTIGELARAAGVPVTTVRYYERANLLRPQARTAGNYRSYSQQSLDRLRFIRSAQATGFSLDDVREFLSLTHSDSDQPPCDEVLTLTRKRLAEIRERIKELRHVEKVLGKALHECCTGQSPDLCADLLRLKGRADNCRPAPRKPAVARKSAAAP